MSLCLITFLARFVVRGLPRSLRVLVLFVLPTAPISAQIIGPDFEAIESHIAATLVRDRVPGAAVAIVRNSEVLFLRGFGTDGSARPVDEDTRFVIGSMSKAFTALVAMRLVAAGRLSLDMPVVTHVPELAQSGGSDWHGVTLRHLLTHTSGVPTRMPDVPLGASLAQYADALADVDLTHPAGENHMYSSGNYLLAARMLETISGMPFEGLLAEQLLEPLGLGHGDGKGMDPEGHQYWFIWPRRVELHPEPGRLATASLTASASDMVRFLQFQLGDGTWRGQAFLRTTDLAEMHRGVARGNGFAYGLGWREVDLSGNRTVQHGGVLPNFQGKIILLPDDDLAVVVLTNASSVLPLPISPTSHQLANDIAMYLTGGPLGLPNLGYRRWLILFWSGLGLILLHQALTLGRVGLGRDPAYHPLRNASFDIAMVLAVVFVLPWAIGLSLPSILVQTPDLALWLAALSGMALCSAAIRVVRAAK